MNNTNITASSNSIKPTISSSTNSNTNVATNRITPPARRIRQQPQKPPVMERLQPGTKLTVGSHLVEVIKYLSEGGFAHIYVVKFLEFTNEMEVPNSLMPGDLCCLKRVFVMDQNGLNELRNEVDVMKKLKACPRIVQYYDSNASRLNNNGASGDIANSNLSDINDAPAANSKNSNVYYEVLLLMELCPNKSLLDYMNNRLQTKLTEVEILKIMYDISQAVLSMHYCTNPEPLIHKDIKIENVLVDKNNEFKLCDFGSTSTCYPIVTTHQEIAILTNNIYIHTTPQYRSPEMIDLYRCLPINEKSDIWALGVFLYKLMFYTTPFELTGQFAILHSKYEIPPNNYSSRLNNLIIIMLSENPSLRPNIYQILLEVCSIMNVVLPENIFDKYNSGPYDFSKYSAYQTKLQTYQYQMYMMYQQKSSLELNSNDLFLNCFEIGPKQPINMGSGGGSSISSNNGNSAETNSADVQRDLSTSSNTSSTNTVKRLTSFGPIGTTNTSTKKDFKTAISEEPEEQFQNMDTGIAKSVENNVHVSTGTKSCSTTGNNNGGSNGLYKTETGSAAKSISSSYKSDLSSSSDGFGNNIVNNSNVIVNNSAKHKSNNPFPKYHQQQQQSYQLSEKSFYTGNTQMNANVATAPVSITTSNNVNNTSSSTVNTTGISRHSSIKRRSYEVSKSQRNSSLYQNDVSIPASIDGTSNNDIVADDAGVQDLNNYIDFNNEDIPTIVTSPVIGTSNNTVITPDTRSSQVFNGVIDPATSTTASSNFHSQHNNNNNNNNNVATRGNSGNKNDDNGNDRDNNGDNNVRISISDNNRLNASGIINETGSLPLPVVPPHPKVSSRYASKSDATTAITGNETQQLNSALKNKLALSFDQIDLTESPIGSQANINKAIKYDLSTDTLDSNSSSQYDGEEQDQKQGEFKEEGNDLVDCVATNQKSGDVDDESVEYIPGGSRYRNVLASVDGDGSVSEESIPMMMSKKRAPFSPTVSENTGFTTENNNNNNNNNNNGVQQQVQLELKSPVIPQHPPKRGLELRYTEVDFDKSTVASQPSVEGKVQRNPHGSPSRSIYTDTINTTTNVNSNSNNSNINRKLGENYIHPSASGNGGSNNSVDFSRRNNALRHRKSEMTLNSLNMASSNSNNNNNNNNNNSNNTKNKHSAVLPQRHHSASHTNNISVSGGSNSNSKDFGGLSSPKAYSFIEQDESLDKFGELPRRRVSLDVRRHGASNVSSSNSTSGINGYASNSTNNSSLRKSFQRNSRRSLDLEKLRKEQHTSTGNGSASSKIKGMFGLFKS
ncbi:uncharacterized protein SCODWIG_01522 [Saccharomycodes ludwigii]|uniref:Protein kinase domain-containing protein n=1 Tax=Saccharomycodes ludwigii TaxID=36035 RepID=A0A376B544_9ASCO|nr:uncharacterized protein SCODWIG_01522 [Saccharomycodes ludwigii]